MAAMYPVVGCEGSSGAFPRLEIRDLSEKPENQYMWSLFVRALNNLKGDKYDPVAASFREIGYIHGNPIRNWKGDVADHGKPPVAEKSDMGYCAHHMPLFPTWHRVYLLLFEQAIFTEAKKIADQDIKEASVKKEEWRAAADQLRLPFWDWAGDQVFPPVFPLVFKEKEKDILIVKKGDGDTEVDNPISSYKLGAVEGAKDSFYGRQWHYWKSWTRTYRQPVGDVGKGFIDNYALLDEKFKNPQYGLSTQLLNNLRSIFGYPFPSSGSSPNSNIWEAFSNNGVRRGKPGEYPFGAALEAPHDSLHVHVGGAGHMGDGGYAGLDPLFFLHHANVDRYYAYWESIYPNYWMDRTDEETPLTPFRKKDGTYWTSRDVRFLYPKTEGPNLRYTYPAVTLPASSEVEGRPVLDVSLPPSSSPRGTVLRGLQQLIEDRTKALKKIAVFLPFPPAMSALRVQPHASLRVAEMAAAASEALEEQSVVEQPAAELTPSDEITKVADSAAFAAPAVEHEDKVASASQEGLNEEFPAAIVIPAAILRPHFFDTTPMEDSTHSHHISNKSRRIVVGFDLKEHAFNGSYVLRLYLKKYSDYSLGSVTVFARSDPSDCPGCVQRDEEGVSLGGTVFIRSKIVEGLLEEAGLNSADATDSEVLSVLKSSFSATLETAGGLVFAQTEDRADGETSDRLGEDVAPKLTLLSVWAAKCTGEEHGDHDFLHEWQNHGLLETAAWVRV